MQHLEDFYGVEVDEELALRASQGLAATLSGVASACRRHAQTSARVTPAWREVRTMNNEALAESSMDGSMGDALQALAEGRVTATDLVRACLRRIQQTPAIAACFQRIDAEQALHLAQSIDASPAESRGALAGIAVAHKDLFARRGRVATFGTHQRYHRDGGESTAPLLGALTTRAALRWAHCTCPSSPWVRLDGARPTASSTTRSHRTA